MNDGISTEDDQGEALRVAAIQGNVEAVNRLLSAGVDASPPDAQGWTPLMLAAKRGRSDVAQLLFDRGAPLDAENRYGATALLYAATEGSASVVSLLCDRGADFARYEGGASLLIQAIVHQHFDAAKTLLDKATSPNPSEEVDFTPLAATVRTGSEAFVRLLLERGADINGDSRGGVTALMEAARLDRIEIAVLLIEQGADVNGVSRRGRTAITDAYSSLEYALRKKNLVRAARAEALIDLLYSVGAKE